MNNIRTHSEDPRRFLERKQHTSVTSVNGYDNLSDKLCSGMKRVKELPKNLFSILYTNKCAELNQNIFSKKTHGNCVFENDDFSQYKTRPLEQYK